MNAAVKQSEEFNVAVSRDSLGAPLFEYIKSLPPALRCTEIARLAFEGFKKDRTRKRDQKQKSAAGASAPASPVVEIIGEMIRWVG